MNERLRSRWTPRYFAWEDQLIWWPFIVICLRFAELFWLKSIVIVFWGFIFSRHFLNHNKEISIWRCRWRIARFLFLFFARSKVSSAKRAMEAAGVTGKSLVNTRYSRGESQEPCETPAEVFLLIEVESSTRTLNFLSSRKDLIIIKR